MSLLRFLRAQEGIALVYFAIMMPAFLGLAVLIIDIGRGNNLSLDLQSAADGLAIAAAAELDGTSDAITRANKAIADLVQNQARFGDVPGGWFVVDEDPGSEIQVFYLDAIPANDNIEIDAAWVTAHDASLAPAAARFAAVYVNPVNYSLLFPLDFFGQTTVPIGAYAVAGFGQTICDFTPLFICNPWEDPDNPGTSPDLATIAADRGQRRRMIEMRQKGGSDANYSPGNFGYLSSPIGNAGANQLRAEIATVNSSVCFDGSTVDLRPGQVASVKNGFNVRFDKYEGFFSGAGPGSAKFQSKYRPARNVRKGYDGNPICNTSLVDPPDPPNIMGLPPDNCFLDDSCIDMDGRRGNGEWNLTDYWQTNFVEEQAAPVAPPAAWQDPDGTPLDDDDPDLPTRYEVYRKEIELNLLNYASPDGEVGAPGCYAGSVAPNDEPDRRLIYGAIIDCALYDGQMQGSANDIPVREFASFFLIDAVQQGGPDDDVLRAELVDVTSVSGATTLQNFQRDDVQLYR